jgi:hypothetical protein
MTKQILEMICSEVDQKVANSQEFNSNDFLKKMEINDKNEY